MEVGGVMGEGNGGGGNKERERLGSLFGGEGALMRALMATCKNDPSNDEATSAIDLLYDTALISSGYTPDSPAELGNKIYEMMAIALGGRWGGLESEANTEAGSGETAEAEVAEPSEVRAESDPWKDG